MNRCRLAVGLAIVHGACAPELDTRNSDVERPRVLVVLAEPPEARPGSAVAYEAVLAGPEGRLHAAATEWAYCTQPKALTDNTAVSPACLTEPGVPLEVLGNDRASGAVPREACQWFGPDAPPGGRRPAEPDATGGYYQPLRLVAFGQPWLHLERVSCSPANVSADVARELAARYVANSNPTLAWAVGAPSTAQPERSVRLAVTWRAGDAERYVAVDPVTRVLASRDETLEIWWFATAGRFASDRTSPASGAATSSENRWLAPRSGEPVVWAVIRDSRGGAAYVERTVSISP